MSRQITEIRHGHKHGPVNRFVDSTNVTQLNPFVLWDHFSLTNVTTTTGFDFHGHSGVTTISYPQIGDIAHEDTGGHSGLLNAGGIQVMAAGSGVLHKETVYPNQRAAEAFQLWVALPKSDSEMGPVRYSTLPLQDIPSISAAGSKTKILIGQYQQQQSPAESPVDKSYLHVQLDADSQWTQLSHASHRTAFIYVRKGTLHTGGVQLSAGELGIFEPEVSPIVVNAQSQGAEFLLISGTPLDQEIISNGASVHSNTTNLIAGAKNIRQLQINGTHPFS